MVTTLLVLSGIAGLFGALATFVWWRVSRNPGDDNPLKGLSAIAAIGFWVLAVLLGLVSLALR